MGANPIRVLVVDAGPDEGSTLQARLENLKGIEVVGVARNRNAAKAEAEALQPDLLLVDLMLPGYRSLHIVRHVADEQPQVHILALTPADPPHDRIMLAVEAGALGYVCRDADSREVGAAIERVHAGEPWLPVELTYEVLQDGAGELAI
jgi:DNA-binding NarL/FixJ family response regulator